MHSCVQEANAGVVWALLGADARLLGSFRGPPGSCMQLVLQWAHASLLQVCLGLDTPLLESSVFYPKQDNTCFHFCASEQQLNWVHLEGGRGLLSHQDLWSISQGCMQYVHLLSELHALFLSGQDRSSLVMLCACLICRPLSLSLLRGLVCQARTGPHLSFLCVCFSQAPFTQLAQGSCVCVFALAHPVGLFTLLVQGPSLSVSIALTLCQESWQQHLLGPMLHADALVRTSCCSSLVIVCVLVFLRPLSLNLLRGLVCVCLH